MFLTVAKARWCESFSQLIVVDFCNLTLSVQEQEENMTSFSIQFVNMVLVVHFYVSKCGQLFLDMQIIRIKTVLFFCQQENRYLKNIMFCHGSIPYIVFFKVVLNKACCF